MNTIELNPLTPHIGAEVSGVDLAEPLSGRQHKAIHDAFLDWQVLVFHHQLLSRDQHRQFARAFGDLHVHPSKTHLGRGGAPDVFEVATKETTRFVTGGAWHTDVSCEAIPPLASMLYLKAGPEVGGDTLFADMYLAFEQLSKPLQAFLTDLTAVHDGRKDLAQYGFEPKPGQSYPHATHPVVVTHPETGRKLLFVNKSFTTVINELERWESDTILDALYAHVASSVQLHCRVRWQPGTLVFWDNRCTQHHAIWDYRPAPRYGDRVSIAGREPPRG